MAELWDILDEHGNKTGRTFERYGGGYLSGNDYHLNVYVWIMNATGKFLIVKRTPNKESPNMWECVGGNAIAGDDSLTTALKEVHEETGVVLEPKNGQFFKRVKRVNNSFADMWLFRQEVDINDVTLCPGETCDAMWVSPAEVMEMMSSGTFVDWKLLPYIEELFECASVWTANGRPYKKINEV